MSPDINDEQYFDDQEQNINEDADKFQIEYVTFHSSFDNRKALEIDVSQYANKNELETLNTIIARHLNVVWKTNEGKSTQSGYFQTGTVLEQAYVAIKNNRTLFFSEVEKIAQSFRDKSPKNATQGIIMIIGFRRNQRHFLAILKMNLSSTDNLAFLDESPDSLKIAIQKIANSLPQAGKEVLKWVVIPHPVLEHVDMKYKDRQNQFEAMYFTAFLGCVKKENEKEQLKDLINNVESIFIDAGAKSIESPKLAAQVIEKLRNSTEQIDNEFIKDAVRTTLDENNLRTNVPLDKIAKTKSPIDISLQTVKTSKMRYHIKDENISIQGPTDAILKYVEKVEDTNGYRWVITIRTNGDVEEKNV